jgi:predicted nucleic acid-binding protein
MLSVVLDTNSFDAIALHDDRLRCVQRAVTEGRIHLIVTHIQIDEVRATPDDAKRKQLLVLASESNTPTSVFIVGVSKLGFAAVSSDEDAAIYDEVAGPRRKHVNDAILLTTALRRGATLVTDERRRLPNRCRKHGVPVLSTAELIAAIT